MESKCAMNWWCMSNVTAAAAADHHAQAHSIASLLEIISQLLDRIDCIASLHSRWSMCHKQRLPGLCDYDILLALEVNCQQS